MELHPVGQVAPGTGHVRHDGLATEFALGADLAGDSGVTSAAKALSWSTIVLTVFFSSRISPFTSTVIFFDRSPRAMAVATSAMLRSCTGEVAGYPVHAVRQVLPGPRHAGHGGLTAQLAFGADLAGHAQSLRPRSRSADPPSC